MSFRQDDGTVRFAVAYKKVPHISPVQVPNFSVQDFEFIRNNEYSMQLNISNLPGSLAYFLWHVSSFLNILSIESIGIDQNTCKFSVTFIPVSATALMGCKNFLGITH